jgi:NitT/TauT family transport system substrate-binding protein
MSITVRRRALSLIAAGAFAALVVSGCTSTTPAPQESDAPFEDVTIKVGIVPTPDAAVLVVGQDQGYFSDLGITLELVPGQGGAAIVPLVVSGEYQMGFSNVLSVLQAREEGLPLKVIAPSGASWGTEDKGINDIVALPGNGIEDAGDLEGKKVGVNTLGAMLELLARNAVETAGGDDEQVTFVELPPGDQLGALLNGDIDAMICSEPFCGIAVSQGAERISNAWYDLAPDIEAQGALWYSTDPQIAANPELYKRLQEALAQSAEYAMANPAETREAILTIVPTMDPKLLETMLLNNWPSDFDPQSLQYIAKAAVKYGMLDEEPDYDDILWKP